VDADKRRALSDFYRTEFLRHLEQLESQGLVSDTGREALNRARRRFISDLDAVCWRSDFPALAETLLSRLDTLTKLSDLDPKRGH
jgi:hypothetical protein